MSGGFVNGIEYPGRAFTAHQAITYAGSLVKFVAGVSNEVDLAVEGDMPIGYVHMGSMAYSTGAPVAAADAYVAVKGLVPGTVVEMPVVAGNIEITIGAEVETAAGGCVDGSDAGAGSMVVGKALEFVANGQAAGTFVKVWVAPRFVLS